MDETMADNAKESNDTCKRSAFWKLPAELRMPIYELVAQGEEAHIDLCLPWKSKKEPNFARTCRSLREEFGNWYEKSGFLLAPTVTLHTMDFDNLHLVEKWVTSATAACFDKVTLRIYFITNDHNLEKRYLDVLDLIWCVRGRLGDNLHIDVRHHLFAFPRLRWLLLEGRHRKAMRLLDFLMLKRRQKRDVIRVAFKEAVKEEVRRLRNRWVGKHNRSAAEVEDAQMNVMKKFLQRTARSGWGRDTTVAMFFAVMMDMSAGNDFNLKVPTA